MDKALFVSAALVAAALAAGCGGGDQGTATTRPPGGRDSRADAASALTPADARRIRSLALHDHLVREVAAGGEMRAATRVVPWVSEGGRELIGGDVHVYLEPAVSLADQRLPVTISPNQKAPTGTPTLYRYGRISATNVGELEVAVDLTEGRAVRIEPAGDAYEVTKLELIGPPPRNPAYAPEPGY